MWGGPDRGCVVLLCLFAVSVGRSFSGSSPLPTQALDGLWAEVPAGPSVSTFFATRRTLFRARLPEGRVEVVVKEGGSSVTPLLTTTAPLPHNLVLVKTARDAISYCRTRAER